MAESLFDNWGNVLSPARNEIVFELKNKNYGAYQLRKEQNRSLAFALLISCSFFALLISIPAIINLFGHVSDDNISLIDINDPVLTPPTRTIELIIPAPPAAKVETAVEKIKFTPYKATDKEITENPAPIQSKENTNIGSETQTGKDVGEVPFNSPGVLNEDNSIHTTMEIEQNPEFPGGEQAMNKFLMNNLQYPAVESDADISGTVYLEFIVDKEGAISEVKLLKGVSGGPGLAKEAMRVIKMMPKWKPGRMNGNPVIVKYHIPIKFSKG